MLPALNIQFISPAELFQNFFTIFNFFLQKKTFFIWYSKILSLKLSALINAYNVDLKVRLNIKQLIRKKMKT